MTTVLQVITSSLRLLVTNRNPPFLHRFGIVIAYPFVATVVVVNMVDNARTALVSTGCLQQYQLRTRLGPHLCHSLGLLEPLYKWSKARKTRWTSAPFDALVYSVVIFPVQVAPHCFHTASTLAAYSHPLRTCP
jgi:hypothetical protein